MGNFSDVSASVGLAEITSDPPYATYQNAWADFDNDGDLDLATNQKLYRNDGETNNNWLKVQLQGDGTFTECPGTAVGEKRPPLRDLFSFSISCAQGFS